MYYDNNDLSQRLFDMQKVTVRLDRFSREIIEAYHGKNFSQKLRNYIRDKERLSGKNA